MIVGPCSLVKLQSQIPHLLLCPIGPVMTLACSSLGHPSCSTLRPAPQMDELELGYVRRRHNQDFEALIRQISIGRTSACASPGSGSSTRHFGRWSRHTRAGVADTYSSSYLFVGFDLGAGIRKWKSRLRSGVGSRARGRAFSRKPAAFPVRQSALPKPPKGLAEGSGRTNPAKNTEFV